MTNTLGLNDIDAAYLAAEEEADRTYLDDVDAVVATLTRVQTFEIDRSRLIRKDLIREIDGDQCGCVLGQYALACGATLPQIDEHSYTLILRLLVGSWDTKRPEVDQRIWEANDYRIGYVAALPNEPEIVRIFAECGVSAVFTGQYDKDRFFGHTST